VRAQFASCVKDTPTAWETHEYSCMHQIYYEPKIM